MAYHRLEGLMNEEQLKKRKLLSKTDTQEQSKKTKEYWDKVKENKQLPLPGRTDLWHRIPYVANHILKNTDKTFVIDEKSKELLRFICLYFAADKMFLEETVLDSNLLKSVNNAASIKKGIILAGNCGTGKTLIMKSAQKIYNYFPDNSFKFATTSQVVTDYNKPNDKGGDEAITRYKNGDWCFDDFGSEEMGSHFGKIEVMKEIILRRYEMFINYGNKTYLTTNLSPQMIEERYGERVMSRLKEMCNIKIITGNDRRK
jgi:DNA replication protein DnaC